MCEILQLVVAASAVLSCCRGMSAVGQSAILKCLTMSCGASLPVGCCWSPGAPVWQGDRGAASFNVLQCGLGRQAGEDARLVWGGGGAARLPY
jgi:hypothetical protein